mmetsp:Transcript_12328/g.18390  ORF Transcript_12328/g.18390 Transcript_12328/m.18390 type:complete len:368 (-) Transcript_12328:103-1206(-)|eukprot:CAMPEP_0167753968 /NCGR_PEP_ID=MMETSP0110_2-20121227/8009_1 /TAXON_ID=629695 /ORGANISM="Gymnochlora sp., Strain CCMP2014" /LENGTH=367 /DNA_ID=CAMNT_0007639795 /DNA_START=72 /DNA_END=1175 /DNA_ORIENTATION=+
MVSVLVAYLLWLFFGFWGLHQIYLGRENHALLLLMSGGGFGLGWFRDFFYMHEYAYQANDIVEHRKDSKPRGSWAKFFGMFIFGTFLRFLCLNAFPEEFIGNDPWAGIIPKAIGLTVGIYLVGNNGYESGPFFPTFVSALISEIMLVLFAPDFYFIMAYVPINIFGRYRTWVPAGHGPRSKSGRCCLPSFKHFFKGTLFLLLVLSCLYFNGSITLTDEETGEEKTYKIRDQLQHIYRSPLVNDVIRITKELYVFVQVNGWKNVWDEIVKAMDVEGEDHAYKVLGLEKGATEAEIKRSYRILAKKYHPDICKGEADACLAKFREVADAYQTIRNLSDANKRSETSNSRQKEKKPGRRRRRRSRVEDEL